MTIKSVIGVVLSRPILEADPEPEPIVRNNMTLAPGRGSMATFVGFRGTGVAARTAPAPGRP